MHRQSLLWEWPHTAAPCLDPDRNPGRKLAVSSSGGDAFKAVEHPPLLQDVLDCQKEQYGLTNTAEGKAAHNPNSARLGPLVESTIVSQLHSHSPGFTRYAEVALDARNTYRLDRRTETIGGEAAGLGLNVDVESFTGQFSTSGQSSFKGQRPC